VQIGYRIAIRILPFFHNFASERKRRNFTKKLKVNGNFIEGTNNLNPIITDYFTNLFTSENNDIDPEFLNIITPKVTNDMNSRLMAPFSDEDVKKFVFSIGDLKACNTPKC
jgi:hypothetical protein